MSIRLKTIISIIIAWLFFFVFFIFTSYNLILKGFDKVENQQVERNVTRVVDALNSKIDDISTKLSDWAQWDDSYKYIQDKNKSFVNSNLTNEAFTALKINLIIFVDTKGVVVRSKFVNLQSGAEEPMPSSLKPYLETDSFLFKHAKPDSVIKGIIDLPGQDMLLVSRPIVTSKDEGPIRGTLIFGRYFDNEIMSSLSNLTHVSLAFTNLDSTSSTSKNTIVPTTGTISANAIQIQPENNNIITGSTVFNTIDNQPALLIKATFNREVHTQGLQSIFSFFLFFAAISLFLGTATILLLDKLILSKLNTLSSGVQKISIGEGTANHIILAGHDEFTQLADQINLMVDTLQKSTEQIKTDETKIKEEAKALEGKNIIFENSEQTLLKVMSDLEETKEKIEKEKIQDETMLESIGEGLIVTDKNGIVMIINKAAQQMLMFTAQELTGKRLSDELIMTDENGTKISTQDTTIEKVLKTGKKETKIQYFVRKDGTSFPSVVTTTAIFMENEITGAISVLRDITKEKEVDKMKSEFISLASHQLRSPITAIKWFTESLLGKNNTFTPDQHDYLENIHNANERMIDLVDSLLNISRIESGRLSVYPKTINLIEVINDIKKEMEGKLLEKKIVFTIDAKPEDSEVSTDPKLIRHVYANLITNSIKYSPAATTIAIHITKKDESVITEVTDNGYGIPVSQQNRLFQKFFRAENIKNKETDGTGLGLYLVKIITDLLGGKVWFKSAENTGTTFWISLPKAGISLKEGEVSLS